jgi:hypothetical protein
MSVIPGEVVIGSGLEKAVFRINLLYFDDLRSSSKVFENVFSSDAESNSRSQLSYREMNLP